MLVVAEVDSREEAAAQSAGEEGLGEVGAVRREEGVPREAADEAQRRRRASRAGAPSPEWCRTSSALVPILTLLRAGSTSINEGHGGGDRS